MNHFSEYSLSQSLTTQSEGNSAQIFQGEMPRDMSAREPRASLQLGPHWVRSQGTANEDDFLELRSVRPDSESPESLLSP